MRARWFSLLICLLLVGLLPALLYAAPIGSEVTITVSPAFAPVSTPRDLDVAHLPGNSIVPVVEFDPSGAQRVLSLSTSAAGTLHQRLTPAVGLWLQGVYRVVVGTGGSGSVSTTFAAGPGGPQLFAGPDMPSPTSALMLQGIGLPSDIPLDATLALASGQGERIVPARTDAAGTFTTYVWPQQVGLPFWIAGRYELRLPGVAAPLLFFVRERPGSATIQVEAPVVTGADNMVHFRHYSPGRYVWGVYASKAGEQGGEFLVGPSDGSGQTDAVIPFTGLAAGTSLLATPYDWGETEFEAQNPPPTATPTSTASPTATLTPVATSTVAPIATVTATPGSAVRRYTRDTWISCQRHRGRSRPRLCKTR